MAAEPVAGPETERRVGPYFVRERTARRLVVERRGAPWFSIAWVGGIALLLVLLIAPWRGGTRLPIAATLAALAAVLGLLIAAFVPQQERLTVDIESRECRLERTYLLARRKETLHVPLDAVKEVRCRQRVWRESPDAAVVRWSVELVGQEAVWRLVEMDQEEPVQELARLMAEVAGIPRRMSVSAGETSGA